jgi:DNA (cytosine-5)-methyltransferase 1
MLSPDPQHRPRAAEFFAGIGLVRAALEKAGFKVAFANDIDTSKRDLYAANFGASEFVLKDVRAVHGDDIPDVELAWASFPCTDLSLAGKRAGLSGNESGMFWEFARVLREMKERRPPVVALENVPSFANSHGGEDLRAAVEELNELGYWCDLFVADARHFVPQSRPRLFIVGSAAPLREPGDWTPSPLRPPWIERFVVRNPQLLMHALDLRLPPAAVRTLADIVERLPPDHPRWWSEARVKRFIESLSVVQSQRLDEMRNRRSRNWATAYRRTRGGRAVWEIRGDSISGCLRTARGGSSKQALVEAGRGSVRIRWMTPREYARLQGAPNFKIDAVSENQALFGLGDGVCVPLVTWIAREYLRPLIEGRLTTDAKALVAHG